MSDTTIKLDRCAVPDCFFAEILAKSVGPTVYLQKNADGFYVLEYGTLNNGNCLLCKNGTPTCVKRIPYFEFLNDPDA